MLIIQDEAALFAYIDKAMERRLGKQVFRRHFLATVVSVSGLPGALQVQVRRQDETATDPNVYLCSTPGYYPQAGDVVECMWRDDVVGYVLWPSARAATGATVVEQQAAAAQAQFSFTVPSGFRVVEFEMNLRGDTAATDTDVKAQFNGDTGANYQNHILVMNGTTAPSLAILTGSTSLEAGLMPAANAVANNFGASRLAVFDYGNALYHKSSYAHGSHVEAGAQASRITHGVWSSVAAITSVVIKPNAGNLVAGSWAVMRVR